MKSYDYEVEFTVKALSEDGEVKMLGCGCGCTMNGSVSVSNTKLVDVQVDGENGLKVMQDSVDRFLRLNRPR